MPKVINVRNNPKGPYVYIGRPEQNGYPLHFGNPFLMNAESERDLVCYQFDAWITNGYTLMGSGSRQEWVIDNLILLHGKDLGCWCTPKRCHGDTLLKLAPNTGGRPVFRVIVAGGRDFSDYQLPESKLDSILEKKVGSHFVVILSGQARGADTLGESYAERHRHDIVRFPAYWKLQGRRAGMIRNAAMRRYADAAVVFWDGGSKGTAEMIAGCRHDNIPLRIISYRKPSDEMEYGIDPNGGEYFGAK